MSKALTFKPDVNSLLKRIEEVFTLAKSRRRLLTRAVLELKDLAAAYPVEGIWNKPPGTRGNNVWYQRNFGTRWKRKNGTLGGRNTSQQLQKRWHEEVMKADEFSASVFTEVTYAPYLLDPQKQVKWADAHGWQDVDEIEKEYAPRFEELVLDEIDKELKK